MVGHFSPAAHGSMEEKKNVGGLSDWEISSTASREMDEVSNLGARPAELLWGESRLLKAF